MYEKKIKQRCTFASDGPGVPLIIKTIAEMESSDDLRSELCTTFLSGMDYVKSYGSSKFAKRMASYVYTDLQ